MQPSVRLRPEQTQPSTEHGILPQSGTAFLGRSCWLVLSLYQCMYPVLFAASYCLCGCAEAVELQSFCLFCGRVRVRPSVHAACGNV